MKNSIKTAVITAIIGGFVAAFTAAAFTFIQEGGLKLPTLDELPEFISRIYNFAPVPLRIAYYAWITVFILYFYAERFDKLHCDYPREIKQKNFAPFSIFVITFLVVLNHLFLTSPSVNKFPIFNEYFGWFVFSGYLVLACGFGIILLARPVINGYWGPHIYKYKDPNHEKLVTTDIYSKLRHPIYIGQIFMSLGTLILSNSYVFILFPLWYTFINTNRAKKEEEDLHTKFDNYSEYKKRVGWFPKIF